MQITLPYNYKPKAYQLPFLKAMDGGCKRAVLVWHRRSGKDKTCLNFMIKEMAKKVGVYYYYYPTQKLGRKALWEGIGKDGFKFINHFPKEFIARKNDAEMRIEAVNGSIFQIIGTDNLDVVGPNPIGNVFSEYSLEDPDAWNYVRPIVAENGGWAVFNYTPRGKNHGYHLANMAKKNKDWYYSVLTVDDTGVITKEAIDDERISGMTEAFIQQEFYCSFNMPIEGSYYGKVLTDLRKSGRIGDVPHNIYNQTWIVLDVGYTTAIWFVQPIGTNFHIIDFYEDIGSGLEEICGVFDKYHIERGYKYANVIVPCDMDSNATKIITGESALETIRGIGYKAIALPKERSVIEGIKRTEKFLRNCYFDETKCRAGIERVEAYHEKVNQSLSSEGNPVFTGVPEKDGNDHAADALRYVSMAAEKGLLINSIQSSGLTVSQIKKLQQQYC